MALSSTAIGTTNTTVYTSSGNNAITSIIVCNVYAYNPSFPTDHTAKFSLWAVASGNSASNTNLIVNAIPITAGETLSLDQEKLVLGNGDTLVALSDSGSTLSITISTLPV
jgi:hypothetical protein